jgi:hypothetical protein
MFSNTRIRTVATMLVVALALPSSASAVMKPPKRPEPGPIGYPTPLPSICIIFPIFCARADDSSGPKPDEVFQDVIAESFEKVGIDPAQAGTTGTLATVDIGGVRGDVQASETGEVTAQIEELPDPGTSDEPEAKEGGAESAETETTTTPEVAPEDGEPPAAPESEAAPTPPEEAPPPASTPEPPPPPEQQVP